MYDEMYIEPYRRENFIIVPLDKRMPLTNNIRTDLNEPLRYLLLVENEEGRIRSGDIILFYPADSLLNGLPNNSFHDFFIKQSINVGGTFCKISLNEIRQYEMDFGNGGLPIEFRLWYGRPTITEPVPDQPYCIDWYLTTTIYYSDGTVQVFEEFLYTQCYDEASGGVSDLPNYSDPEYKEIEIEYEVASRNQGYENWKMYATYKFFGWSYPGNSASNSFDSSPEYQGSIIMFGNGYHLYPPNEPWHINFLVVRHLGGLTNSNTAYTDFKAILEYTNQQPYPRTELQGIPKSWNASIVLQ